MKSKTHPLQAVFGGDRDALVDGFPGQFGPVLVTHHFGREPDFAVALVRHGFVEFLDGSAHFLLVVICVHHSKVSAAFKIRDSHLSGRLQ